MPSVKPVPVPDDLHDQCRNEVHLVGVVRRPPVERALPSGDLLVSWSLRVPRPPGGGGQSPGPRGTGDSIELSAWTGALRRRCLAFEPGDVIECHGALRRQVRSGPTGLSSRYEVELRAVRRVSRAPRS